MDHVRLAINVDHVATVRNARGTDYPDPVHLAVLALNAGAEGIVAHLREDRRHIRERDVELLRATCGNLDLEIAMWDEGLDFAEDIQPNLITFVPEKREELTTEGGLNVIAHKARVTGVVTRFMEAGVEVSLFVDPEREQIEAAAEAGTRFIELHTGRYADAPKDGAAARELDALRRAAALAGELGLRVNAGHGLTAKNVGPVARIPEVEELSIGHAVIARSIAVGMEAAVREMREAVRAGVGLGG